LAAGSHSILVRWRNYFSQLSNGVNDGRQTEIHTAEPLVPEPSAFEDELDIEKLKVHKSSSNDHIPAELIKARGRIIRYEIYKLVTSIWNKEELLEVCKVSTI
jgi:hypothetical protein